MTISNSGRDFLVHLMLLPVLEFLMTSPGVIGRDGGAKQRGVIIALGTLLTITAIKIGLEITYKEPSYYDMMEVPADASSADIKKGYKRASLKVHPDKI